MMQAERGPLEPKLCLNWVFLTFVPNRIMFEQTLHLECSFSHCERNRKKFMQQLLQDG
jgi:hypothetical protein